MIHYNDSDYLCHHGVKGMKWGHRKKRDKSSFDTSYRRTALDTRGRLLLVNGQSVNYKNKAHRKAAKAAFKEGIAYNKAFKSKARVNEKLSVMGNKFVESLKKQKVPTNQFERESYEQYHKRMNDSFKKHYASVMSDVKRGNTSRHPGL